MSIEFESKYLKVFIVFVRVYDKYIFIYVDYNKKCGIVIFIFFSFRFLWNLFLFI